jgi:hypothetical protein
LAKTECFEIKRKNITATETHISLAALLLLLLFLRNLRCLRRKVQSKVGGAKNQMPRVGVRIGRLSRMCVG